MICIVWMRVNFLMTILSTFIYSRISLYRCIENVSLDLILDIFIMKSYRMKIVNALIYSIHSFINDWHRKTNVTIQTSRKFITDYHFEEKFYFFLEIPRVAERRYNRVKRWLRDVDLFAKTYIIVPINQNAHWYIVLIQNLNNVPTEGDLISDDEDDSHG